jgi:hypothetical protein
MDWRSFFLGAIAAYAVPWLAVGAAACVYWLTRDLVQTRRRRARQRRAIRAWARQTFGEEAALLSPGASVDDVAKAMAAHQARRDAEAVEALLGSLKQGA